MAVTFSKGGIDMLVRKCDVCGKEINNSFWNLVADYYIFKKQEDDTAKEIRVELCKECMEKNPLYEYAKKKEMI